MKCTVSHWPQRRTRTSWVATLRHRDRGHGSWGTISIPATTIPMISPSCASRVHLEVAIRTGTSSKWLWWWAVELALLRTHPCWMIWCLGRAQTGTLEWPVRRCTSSGSVRRTNISSGSSMCCGTWRRRTWRMCWRFTSSLRNSSTSLTWGQRCWWVGLFLLVCLKPVNCDFLPTNDNLSNVPICLSSTFARTTSSDCQRPRCSPGWRRWITLADRTCRVSWSLCRRNIRTCRRLACSPADRGHWPRASCPRARRWIAEGNYRTLFITLRTLVRGWVVWRRRSVKWCSFRIQIQRKSDKVKILHSK